jgi:hypothetical protein
MRLRYCVCLFLSFWITGISELNAQEPKPPVAPSIEAAVRAFEQYDLSQSHTLYRRVIANPVTSRDDRVKASWPLPAMLGNSMLILQP